jgi:hypothetical protein
MKSMLSSKRRKLIDDASSSANGLKIDPKKTPRKFVGSSKIKNEDKLSEKFILLSGKKNVLAQKSVLNKQMLDYKCIEPLFSEETGAGASLKIKNIQKQDNYDMQIPEAKSSSLASQSDSIKSMEALSKSKSKQISVKNRENRFCEDKTTIPHEQNVKNDVIENCTDREHLEIKLASKKRKKTNLHMPLSSNSHIVDDNSIKTYQAKINKKGSSKLKQNTTSKRKQQDLSSSIEKSLKLPNKKKKLPR